MVGAQLWKSPQPLSTLETPQKTQTPRLLSPCGGDRRRVAAAVLDQARSAFLLSSEGG